MAVDAKAQGLQVLATLYPDQAVRDARVAELGDAGLTALGNSVLMRGDYSREMNELQTQRTALTTAEQAAKDLYESNKDWHAQKLADLQELDRLRAQIAGNPNPNPNPNPANPDPAAKFVTPEQLADTERGAVQFFTELNALSLQHFQQFGEILDTQKLITDKRVQQVGLRGVYAEVYKPQLDARVLKQRQDAEAAVRLDERNRVLAERGASHFPQLVRSAEPSTLDAFERKATDQAPAVKTIDDMAAEYTRLQSTRTGTSA